MLEVDLQSPENHPQTPKGGFKNVDNFVASMGGSMQLAVPFALCPAPFALRPFRLLRSCFSDTSL